jgi:CRP-like cAMP-binding protein
MKNMDKLILQKHIESQIDVTDLVLSQIVSYFENEAISKKEILLSEGNNCNRLFFVTKGCLHLYFYDSLGNKKTTQFAIENWWLTDFLAFQKEGTSSFYIEAIENSEVLSISFLNLKHLLNDFPQMEKYFRIIYEIAYGSALMRLKYVYSYSKEDIYFKFRDDFPNFIQRVPQYLIASFLGLTPEYLSEIKKKKVS